MALRWSIRWCHARKAAAVAAFQDLFGERDFAAENFYTISTDTHIDYLVISLRGAHKNATGTVHFEALLDQDALLAGGHAVGDHPRGATSGR